MEGVRKTLTFAVFGTLIWGCGKEPEVPYPDWTAGSQPESAPSAAYLELKKAAEQAETAAGKDLYRVSFTPGKKSALVASLAPAVQRALRAVRKPVLMQDRSGEPFEPLRHQPGWRMIGRALTWGIENDIAFERYASAAENAAAAIRFGLALTGGSAGDAALGYQTISEALAAFQPAFSRLQSSELRILGNQIEAALKNRPEPMEPVDNEYFSMLAAVQHVQDAFRDRKLGDLKDELGKDIEPAVEYLQRLSNKSQKDRAAYFRGFAAEAEAFADRYETLIHANARQRVALPKFELEGDRPWRRFSKHFFTALEPLIPLREAVMCQVRLLGLEALLQAECRVNGVAPSTLTGIPDVLKTDPYTGKPFFYRPEGRHFLLYSAGRDLEDDGGEPGQDVLLGKAR